MKAAIALAALSVAFAGAGAAERRLSFEERVALEVRIERVHDAHREWPKDNPQPKPPFEQRVRREAITAKVELYLRKSAALESYWQRPVTERSVQREVERMARATRDPDLLRELFAALHNDPYLIAECLGRPSVATRDFALLYPRCERIHGATRREAEALRATLTAQSFSQAIGIRTITYAVGEP